MKNTYYYQLIQSKSLTSVITQILMRPFDQVMPYKAGQYIELRYPDGSYQPFSIANAPAEDGFIELHVLCSPMDDKNRAFVQHALSTQKIEFLGPFGRCTYEKIGKQPTILLAGGVGFSQVKAIMEQFALLGVKQPIHFCWGIKNADHIYLQDIFKGWRRLLPNFRYKIVFLEPEQSYVHEAVVEDHPNLGRYEVLAAGPKEMVLSARTLFKQHGLPSENIYSDWFDFI